MDELETEGMQSMLEKDWRETRSSLSEQYGYMLTNELRTDVAFIVGSSPQNQKIFHCNRFPLARASSVFDFILYDTPKETPSGIGDDMVTITNVEPETFQLLLQYIYTGSVNFGNVEEALSLFSAANYFDMIHLCAFCADYIYANINPDMFWLAFEQALESPKQLGFMARLLQYLQENAKLCLESSFFKYISPKAFKIVLTQEKLNIDSEMDLIFAAVKWGSQEAERLFGNRLSFRRALEPYFSNLRFLTLPPAQFSIPLMSDLLTPDEKLSTLVNIASTNKMKLASSICPNRQSRVLNSSDSSIDLKPIKMPDYIEMPPGHLKKEINQNNSSTNISQQNSTTLNQEQLKMLSDFSVSLKLQVPTTQEQTKHEAHGMPTKIDVLPTTMVSQQSNYIKVPSREKPSQQLIPHGMPTKHDDLPTTTMVSQQSSHNILSLEKPSQQWVALKPEDVPKTTMLPQQSSRKVPVQEKTTQQLIPHDVPTKHDDLPKTTTGSQQSSHKVQDKTTSQQWIALKSDEVPKTPTMIPRQQSIYKSSESYDQSHLGMIDFINKSYTENAPGSTSVSSATKRISSEKSENFRTINTINENMMILKNCEETKNGEKQKSEEKMSNDQKNIKNEEVTMNKEEKTKGFPSFFKIIRTTIDERKHKIQCKSPFVASIEFHLNQNRSFVGLELVSQYSSTNSQNSYIEDIKVRIKEKTTDLSFANFLAQVCYIKPTKYNDIIPIKFEPIKLSKGTIYTVIIFFNTNSGLYVSKTRKTILKNGNLNLKITYTNEGGELVHSIVFK